MTSVIAELRSARLRSNAVESVAPDLVPMVREYERELADGGFTDWPGTLELATNAIAELDRHRLVGLPTLLLDVSISTEAEFAFVTALAAAAPEMLAAIPAADLATRERFRDRLGFKVEDLDHAAGANKARSEATGALGRLQRHLFSEYEKPSEIESGSEIEIFSAPGEGRECVEIARRVLALASKSFPGAQETVFSSARTVERRGPSKVRTHLIRTAP
jgi:hypothetical protein